MKTLVIAILVYAIVLAAAALGASLMTACSTAPTVEQGGLVTAEQKVAANAYAAARAEDSIVAGYHAGLVKCASLKSIYRAGVIPARALIQQQWESLNPGAKADYLDYLDKIIGGIEIVGNGTDVVAFRKRALAPGLTPAEIADLVSEAEAAEAAAQDALDAVYVSCGGVIE